MCINFFNKKLVLHGKKARFFLDLYTKTHLWASTRLEKKGGLACTRNGLKAQFFDFSANRWTPLPSPVSEYHETNLVLFQIIFCFVCLYENLGF